MTRSTIRGLSSSSVLCMSYVVVDGCRSKLVNVVSGVPQGSVFGPQLFLLYTAELFSIVENKLYGCADDSTLVAVVPSPGELVAVSESMNRDLNRVSVWCNLCGMKLNARCLFSCWLSLWMLGWMLSCWHDLLFLFCRLLFHLFIPSMGGCVWVWVFGLIECSHSLPALHNGLQIIIIMTIDYDRQTSAWWHTTVCLVSPWYKTCTVFFNLGTQATQYATNSV